MLYLKWLAILGKSLRGLPSSAIKKCPLRSGRKKVIKGKIITKFITRQLAP